MDNAVTQKILFEIKQIDELVNESAPLLELCRVRKPDFVERCGAAMILQSFYNGIESILSMIIKNKDVSLPNGIKWHKELLAKAFEQTENRTQILKGELKVPLNDYMQFRHFVRHSYGFQLKWEKMKTMLYDMNTIWKDIKDNINIFIENN